MLTSWRFWLGASFSLLFLFLFLFSVDLRGMAQALGDATYTLLVPAVPVYFVAVFFRTLRWRLLLRPLGSPTRGQLFPVVVVGYMANNLLPVRLGELVRAYYLGQKTGLSKTGGLATIVVERVVDGLTLLFLAVVVAFFLPTLGLLRGLGESIGIPWLALLFGLTLPFILALGIFLIMAANPPELRRVIERLLLLLPARWRPRAGRLAFMFIQGLGALRSPRQVAAIFLLSVLIWLSEWLVYFLLGFAFGLHHLFSYPMLVAATLLTTAISNLAIALPSSQGGVGPFEFFARETLVLLGAGVEVASAYALVLHGTLLVPVTLLGLAYLWRENLSLRRLVPKAAEEGRETIRGG